MSDTVNYVRLSHSGLLVEIETSTAGVVTGSVQIDRASWPSVVRMVADCMTERRVAAAVATIADGASDETYED